MIFEKQKDAPYTVLCLGAHSDDIEIGCGGSILRLIEEYPQISIRWVVFSANSQRRVEAFDSARTYLAPVQDKRVIVRKFKDGFFPYMGGEIKEYFELLKQDYSPDLIFTHYRNDLHQDHRIISELTWNTFRNHFILEYEIPKYDGDLGVPNYFICLDESACQAKVKHLFDHFKSQQNQHWFTEDTFLALMRLRGVECRSHSKYAEAFHCRKFVV